MAPSDFDSKIHGSQFSLNLASSVVEAINAAAIRSLAASTTICGRVEATISDNTTITHLTMTSVSAPASASISSPPLIPDYTLLFSHTYSSLNSAIQQALTIGHILSLLLYLQG